jgi:MFS family permease
MLLSSLGASIANVALPTLAQAFEATFQEVQWVTLAYLLAITTLIVSVGKLGDVTGRRRLLLAGIFLFTLASLLCGVAPTLWLLIAARAAQGLGAAIMMALTLAFVGATVPKAKTGSAMGLLGTMSAIGAALGPSLGGVLIAGLGWRAIFLSRALALNAARVGIVLSVGPLVAALTGVPAGRIADRFGAQRVTIVGLIGIAAGSLILSMTPATLGVSGYIAPIIVITTGYALFQTANNTAVMKDIRPDQRGVISGLLNLSRNLGLISGASFMGAVFALASATIDITTARPEAVAAGMRITFAVAVILIVVALAIAAIATTQTQNHPDV